MSLVEVVKSIQAVKPERESETISPCMVRSIGQDIKIYHSEEEHDAFWEMVTNEKKTYSVELVARSLRREGFRISGPTITKHRHGKCSCPKLKGRGVQEVKSEIVQARKSFLGSNYDRRTPLCPLGRVLKHVSEAPDNREANSLIAMVADQKSFSAPKLEQILEAENLWVSKSTIKEHRSEKCPCYRNKVERVAS